ncbi:hypothetical protein EMCRGX_G002528 [Ephydatia muelleri]
MDVRGHAKCVRSRWPTSLKWTKASRNPDVSNWIGHAKCVRSRWPTSPKWTKASSNPDVSNWICLTETNHLRLNYALNLESSVQSVVEVPEVHLGASVNVGLMQSGLTETKEHSPHVGLEAECFEDDSDMSRVESCNDNDFGGEGGTDGGDGSGGVVLVSVDSGSGWAGGSGGGDSSTGGGGGDENDDNDDDHDGDDDALHLSITHVPPPGLNTSQEQLHYLAHQKDVAYIDFAPVKAQAPAAVSMSRRKPSQPAFVRQSVRVQLSRVKGPTWRVPGGHASHGAIIRRNSDNTSQEQLHYLAHQKDVASISGLLQFRTGSGAGLLELLGISSFAYFD